MSRKRLAQQVTVAVVYEPDEDGWHVFIPSIQGCRSWGRSITEARRNIREALDACQGVHPAAEGIPPDAAFEEDIRLPAVARTAVKRYARVKGKAEAMATELREASNAAAVALIKRTGVSLRDAGELLGLSAERVRKVLKEGEARG
jgi:predicted RNase H-like HicB family nuclease